MRLGEGLLVLINGLLLIQTGTQRKILSRRATQWLSGYRCGDNPSALNFRRLPLANAAHLCPHRRHYAAPITDKKDNTQPSANKSTAFGLGEYCAQVSRF